MRQIYFGDFQQYVIAHVKEIEKAGIQPYTTEWFLVRYLHKIIKRSEGTKDYGTVEGSIHALIRFYVDNIDENSELGVRCIKIHRQYRKLLRQQQSSKYS